MCFAEEDCRGGSSDARLVVALLGASPGHTSKVASMMVEAGERGQGWRAGGRGVFQQLTGCHRCGGCLVASQGLPLCLQRSRCCGWAALAARLPSFGGLHLCCIAGEGAFWESACSFLGWKPFGRCFDLHFHFFFMLLEQHRTTGETDTINFEAQVLRCRLGKRRPVWGGRGTRGLGG